MSKRGLAALATKAITVRIEFAVKKQAEEMLDDMGLDMTTYIIASVKALVRERRIPFEMATTQYLNDQSTCLRFPEARKAAANSAQTVAAEPAADTVEPDDIPQPQPEVDKPVEIVAVPEKPVRAVAEKPARATPEKPKRAVPEKPAEAERTFAYPTRKVATQFVTDRSILDRLAEAEAEAGEPGTQLLGRQEIFGRIRGRQAYEI